jgi:hypothetical protein
MSWLLSTLLFRKTGGETPNAASTKKALAQFMVILKQKWPVMS